MAKLVWDQTGERLFETGVDRGVLFPKNSGTYQTGVAWNGLTAVNEQPSGGEPTAIYADNITYLNLMSVEKLALTIEAYTYPDEFEACDGSASVAEGVTIGQQTRKHFGFVYRSLIGNDEEDTDHGYKLHIVYDCQASPSEKGHSTVNETPEAITFSWSVTTTPIPMVDGFKPSTELVIDSTKTPAAKMKQIEDLLYGTDSAEPTLPMPSQIISIINAA